MPGDVAFHGIVVEQLGQVALGHDQIQEARAVGASARIA